MYSICMYVMVCLYMCVYELCGTEINRVDDDLLLVGTVYRAIAPVASYIHDTIQLHIPVSMKLYAVLPQGPWRQVHTYIIPYPWQMEVTI